MDIPTGDVHHARHDWTDDRSLVTTTLTTVANATNTPVEELPSLYRVISPDALEAILSHGSAAEDPTTVTFEYSGHVVTVDSDGDITVRADGS